MHDARGSNLLCHGFKEINRLWYHAACLSRVYRWAYLISPMFAVSFLCVCGVCVCAGMHRGFVRDRRTYTCCYKDL